VRRPAVADLFRDVKVVGDPKADEKKVERAVVLVSEFDTRIVFGRGGTIESDKEAGLGSDEAGPTALAPEEKGLWLWEGIPGWCGSSSPWGDNDGGEPVYEGRGTWRRLTDEEALKVARGDFSFFGPDRLGPSPDLEEPHHG
jgi:hypothetical protein